MYVKRCISLTLIAILLNPATSTLLCYDCDAGRECEDPILHNVRTVNCDKQYPEASQNNEVVCLALDVTLSGSRGFSLHKSGIYRGCRVISKGQDSSFCDNLKTSYANRLQINSCQFCNTTRCIP